MSFPCPCDLVSTLLIALLLVLCPVYFLAVLCHHYMVCYCLYYVLLINLLSCVNVTCCVIACIMSCFFSLLSCVNIKPCSFPCGLVSSLHVVLLLVLCPVYFSVVFVNITNCIIACVTKMYDLLISLLSCVIFTCCVMVCIIQF